MFLPQFRTPPRLRLGRLGSTAAPLAMSGINRKRMHYSYLSSGVSTIDRNGSARLRFTNACNPTGYCTKVSLDTLTVILTLPQPYIRLSRYVTKKSRLVVTTNYITKSG